MGFSHFYGTRDKHICTITYLYHIKQILWSDMVLAVDFFIYWYWFFFHQQIVILEDGNIIYSRFDFLPISKKLF